MLIQKQYFTPNDVSKTIQHRQSKHTELDFGVKVIMEINNNDHNQNDDVIDFQVPVTWSRHHHTETFDKYYSNKYI